MSTQPESRRDQADAEPTHLGPHGMSVEDALKKLQRISWDLRRLGIVIAVLAAMALLSVLGVALVRVTKADLATKFMILGTNVASCCGGFAWLIVWNRQRDRGMILYEEISDELEWRHRTYRPANGAQNGNEGKRPDLGIRLILREFLASTSLPLVPGPSSGVMYLGFFLVCILIVTLIVGIGGMDLIEWLRAG